MKSRKKAVFGGEGRLRKLTSYVKARIVVRIRKRKICEVLESISDAFYAVDGNWKIKLVNYKTEEWWNSKREDIVGKLLWDVYPEAGKNIAWEMHYKAVRERVPVHWEESLKPGLWLEISAYPTSFGMLAVYLHDITERKEKEKALRESEHLYRTLFENTEDAFQIVEPIYDESSGNVCDFRFIKVNSLYERQTGLKAAGLIGRRVTEVFPDIEPYWIEKYGEVAAAGKPMHYQNYNKNTRRWYDVFYFPYINGHIGALFRNVTQHRRIDEKLAFQANLLSSVHDAIIAVDKDQTVTYWNAMAEEITGWSEKEMLGKSVGNVFNNVVLEDVWQEISDEFDRSGYYSAEMPALKKDGTIIWTDVHIRRMNDYNEQNGCIITSFRDITEKKSKAEELKLAKEDLAMEVETLLKIHRICTNVKPQSNLDQVYSEILNTAIDLSHADKGNIQILDGDGRKRRIIAQKGFHEPFIQYYENTPPENAACGIAARDRERVIVKDVSSDPIFVGMEDLDYLIDEDVRCVQSTPMVSNIGNLVGVLSTHYSTEHDFSMRELRVLDLLAHLTAGIIEMIKAKEKSKQNEKRALELVEQLQRTDKNKNEFLGVLSHELRNPLATIMAGISLLDITNDENKAQQAKDAIKRQVVQLCRLVEDLLDLTRINEGRIRLKKEQVDLNLLAARAAEDINAQYEQKGIRLETHISSEPFYIEADPARITQAIGNLLINALKFTDNGYARLTVYREENNAIVGVTDSGVGINSGMLPRLFEPFSQADDSLDRSGGGLGLGLAITKGIVELHGGNVCAHSEGPGRGAEFEMRLPLFLGYGKQYEEKRETEKRVRKLKVLIIEDNVDFVSILGTMLEEMGHEVISETTGPEGLNKAKALRPDVIFCDIGLPGMDGYTLARLIRENNDIRDTYLIALTGYASPQDIAAAMESGFDRHVAKPLDNEVLKKLIFEVSLNRF